MLCRRFCPSKQTGQKGHLKKEAVSVKTHGFFFFISSAKTRKSFAPVQNLRRLPVLPGKARK
jgi:hypothetical protein